MPESRPGDWAVIIPARFQSSRFPGKPLVDIRGKSLIRRVWDQCIDAVGPDQVIVATDDLRIANHVAGFGAAYEMTSPDHLTGTDRIWEVVDRLDLEYAINVQGDEPLVDPDVIRQIGDRTRQSRTRVVNAMAPIASDERMRSVNVPKVVCAPDGRLLYMSRSPIPGSKDGGPVAASYQVCVYGLPRELLQRFVNADRTPLECAEDIEILRFLELGIPVTMIQVDHGSIAVDTPEDIPLVEAHLDGG